MVTALRILNSQQTSVQHPHQEIQSGLQLQIQKILVPSSGPQAATHTDENTE